MTFGQIRIPIDDADVYATLTSGGWYCSDVKVANYLNMVHSPEIPAANPTHPDPWNALLDGAAADWQGEVVSRTASKGDAI
jgi:hypothetical protein